MERIEQRQFKRHPVRLPSRIAIDATDIVEAVVLDLSLGGCRLTCPKLLAPESMIAIQIRHHQIDPITIPRAMVRWARETALGVQFRDLSESQSVVINRLLWSLPPSPDQATSC